MNNGIFIKIERDITTSTAFRGYFDILWIPEMLRPNEPLTTDHALPSFVALGLGLITATLTFSLEVLFCKKNSANQVASKSEFSDRISDNLPKRVNDAQIIGK